MKFAQYADGRATRRLFAALALALACVSCRRQTDPQTQVDLRDEPRAASVYVVPIPDEFETRTAPVFIKGATTAKLSFRVPGRIEVFNAEIGKRFREGEVVAKLDDRDYQLVVARAKQALVEANAALKAMETGARPEDVSSAEAALAAARSQRETAEKQFARVDSLNRDGAASEMQRDLAKTTLDGALAAERAAEKTLEKAKAGSRVEEIEMMKAKIAGLEIDLKLAENKLEDSVLLAPFSGVVSEKFFDAHESVLPGLSVATLVDDEHFEGEISADEELTLRKDDLVSIECAFDAAPGKVFDATLKQASTSARKGNRSYLATLDVKATPEDGLLVGMVGVAKAVFKNPSARAFVPVAALAPFDDSTPSARSAVWIVDPDSMTVSKREVTVGDAADGRAAILSGLSGGELIVAAGARFLTEGERIRYAEKD